MNLNLRNPDEITRIRLNEIKIKKKLPSLMDVVKFLTEYYYEKEIKK